MEDDERRLSRCFGHQEFEVAQEIAPHDTRRIASRDGKRRAEIGAAIILLRPDQRVQPGHVLIGHDIERIEIKARAPDDARRRGRQQCRTRHGTAEDGRVGTGWRNTDVPPIVAVAVGQQAKAGGRPHFDEGQRLRQGRQQRQQNGATCGLVGLGGARQHRGAKLVGTASNHVGQQRDVGRPSGDQGRRAQQEIRLASRWRQVDQEAQDIGRSGDVLRQALIVRRDSLGFVGCESAIALRETGERFLSHERR
jgi:hypothetical protein